MFQGGGCAPKSTDNQPRPPIKHEGVEAAAKGGLHNPVATLSMARTNNPHSATAQFFINVKDNDFLDHRAPSGQGWGYVAFGKVISGMDVVTRIRQMPTGPGGPFPTDAPLNQVIIQSATLVK